MPDLSKNGIKYKPKTHRLSIPAKNIEEYKALFNKLVGYHKDLVDDIITSSGQVIKCPMDTDLMERYLDGYQINYIPYYDGTFEPEEGKPVRGSLEVVDLEAGIFNVYYNTYYWPKTQRATRIHETWHILQLVDPMFRSFLDDLVKDTELSADFIQMLHERATEQATFIYLMPNDFFRKKFQEILDVKRLSDFFQASIESVGYRIKELGLVMIEK